MHDLYKKVVPPIILSLLKLGSFMTFFDTIGAIITMMSITIGEKLGLKI